MISSNRTKIFYIFFAFTFFISACGTQQNSDNGNNNSTPIIAQETESGIPFSTKEPENYQAEIVFSTYFDGEKSESKTFVARNSASRLTKFYFGDKSESAKLETADGKIYLLDSAKKIYVENTANLPAKMSEEDSLQNFLTVEKLNEKTDASFENQGEENSLTKYSVRLNGAEASEILILYDETAKIVVRQEFYSRNGEQKTLLYSVELKNIQTQTDANLFQLPKGFTKVSLNEFAAARTYQN